MKKFFLTKLRKLKYLLELLLFLNFRKEKKIVFLFGVPSHSNLGDQTQTMCIKKWFKVNYPNYVVREFQQDRCGRVTQKIIHRYIHHYDKIVCHSGYHLTDLYSMEDIYKNACKIFVEFPILIFPQTIFYKSELKLQDTANVLNKQGNVTLMVRDSKSYETAKHFFTGCRLLLYPDIVTSLIGSLTFSEKREGILFCTRNDLEAYYSHEQIECLRKRFYNLHTEKTDTTLPLQSKYMIRNREKILQDIVSSYSRFKLVITDRYHGTILSLISGTPVIVLKTSDHKLSSGVDWFPDSFHDYVSLADDLDEAYELAKEILNKKLDYKLTPYFKENYYDKLKNILENENG